MNYEMEKDDKIYYYHVTYDVDKLKEIFKELEDYSYIATGCGNIIEEAAREITKWPATDTMIEKRVRTFLKKISTPDICSINVEVLDKNHVGYNYTYRKLPELYKFIDLLINNTNPLKYKMLFGKEINKYYFLFNYSQILLDGLLNYIDSEELKNDDLNKEINMNNKNYDYKGLFELYKKTLECFKFNLYAIKEKVDNQEEIDGLSIQKKKL